MRGVTIDGRYELLQELGRGATGVVYRARQLSVHGRDVALKLIEPALLGNRTSVQRFENESKIISQLRHPSTIKLFDVGQTEDARLFIVTELVEGRPLLDVLNAGPMTTQRAVRILLAITGALEEAHSKSIIHRDLKPSNVLLEAIGDQEVVKVLDFGIAKMADTKLTAPTQICGTPGYMAPEQCMGVPVDPRADLFSLGAIAYFMLCGQPPFEGEDADALMADSLERDPAPLRERAPDIPPQLAELVMSLLAKHPADRPENASAVRVQLSVVLESGVRPAPIIAQSEKAADVQDTLLLQPSTSKSEPLVEVMTLPVWTEQRLRRRSLALFFAATALSFLLVVGVLYLTSATW